VCGYPAWSQAGVEGMGKFWFLLTIAFIDLAVALVLRARGYGSEASLFLLMAAILGVYAFVSAPSAPRDARGRLKPAEVPYGSVLGTVGALVILSAAAYVASISTRPSQPAPRQVQTRVEVPRQVPQPPAYTPPRSYSPAASGAALYKCVGPQGNASFQSQPCPSGSKQAWVRDATPEPEPTPAQRRQLARQRAAAARSSAQAPSYGAYSSDGGRQNGNPGSSSACQSARAADAAYRRRPLREVTHDGLRRHGDLIREACS